MKKRLVRKKRSADEETLRSEYRFDYSKSQPNRFRAKMAKGTVMASLDGIARGEKAIEEGHSLSSRQRSVCPDG